MRHMTHHTLNVLNFPLIIFVSVFLNAKWCANILQPAINVRINVASDLFSEISTKMTLINTGHGVICHSQMAQPMHY